MRKSVTNPIWLAYRCVLWVLTRSLQYVFEVSGLQSGADSISGAELDLQVEILEGAKELSPVLKSIIDKRERRLGLR